MTFRIYQHIYEHVLFCLKSVLDTYTNGIVYVICKFAVQSHVKITPRF
jgi:hypothetical protein